MCECLCCSEGKNELKQSSIWEKLPQLFCLDRDALFDEKNAGLYSDSSSVLDIGIVCILIHVALVQIYYWIYI